VATPRIESPCTRQCTLDPETDICLGCYRTLKEILGWSKYSNKQRQAVLGKLPARKMEYALKRAAEGSSGPLK
jgi:predicted Fe-S protein YdhL (DUF1289 family)